MKGKRAASDSISPNPTLAAQGHAQAQYNLGFLACEVADRVGPIWGIGPDGELQNMYARTAQEGFYVAGGGFPAARVYSQYTAMLIKADLEGLLPPHPPGSRQRRSLEASTEQLERAS
jgi:hypothetical protein